MTIHEQVAFLHQQIDALTEHILLQAKQCTSELAEGNSNAPTAVYP